MAELTALQACLETKELWTKLAEESVKQGKYLEKWDIPGPWRNYKCNCPCCEFTVSDSSNNLRCNLCPMLNQWLAIADISEDSGGSCFCEHEGSPYSNWINYTSNLCIDIEFFCLLIADMAEEAAEEHKLYEASLYRAVE